MQLWRSVLLYFNSISIYCQIFLRTVVMSERSLWLGPLAAERMLLHYYKGAWKVRLLAKVIITSSTYDIFWMLQFLATSCGPSHSFQTTSIFCLMLFLVRATFFMNTGIDFICLTVFCVSINHIALFVVYLCTLEIPEWSEYRS